MKSKAALTSNQVTPGILVEIDGKVYRVESAVKVTVAKGPPFIKTKLKDMLSGRVIEKNFAEGQSLAEAHLDERSMEFLYIEGKDYLFLDTGNLETILVSKEIIGDRVNYIKEGIEVKAKIYGDKIFSIELPQFLEIMVVKTDAHDSMSQLSGATKTAYLETGAEIQVPLFVEAGDIVKVDTASNEFVQRV